MRLVAMLLTMSMMVWASGAQTRKATLASGFPNTVRVRIWYVHPAARLKITAESGRAKYRKCAKCAETSLVALSVSATGSQVQVEGDKAAATELHVSGNFQIATATNQPLKADFPVDVHASDGKLQLTAVMP